MRAVKIDKTNFGSSDRLGSHCRRPVEIVEEVLGASIIVKAKRCILDSLRPLDIKRLPYEITGV